MAEIGGGYEYYDNRFYDLTVPIAELEEIYNGCRWAEGPVWFNEHAMLLWSDIPNRRMLRWIEGQGTSVYRADSNFVNGNTRDQQGRLISCEHGGRRVTRTEPNGTRSVVDPGVPDGLRVDTQGNVWTSCGNGVVCFDADGAALGKIDIPQIVSNLTFGGDRRNRLFIAATKSVYAVYVAVIGVQAP